MKLYTSIVVPERKENFYLWIDIVIYLFWQEYRVGVLITFSDRSSYGCTGSYSGMRIGLIRSVSISNRARLYFYS